MQGHGTVPGGLVNATWEDWSAAVRMGARHMRRQIGPDRPLVLVGYSNGGALVTKYTLDALDDATLPPPAQLILLSPMIGVSPAARLAARHQPARPRGRQGALDRRGARVQPVQVQLVPRERGGADARGSRGARQPAGAGRTGRPARPHAAGAGIPVGGGYDREHAPRSPTTCSTACPRAATSLSCSTSIVRRASTRSRGPRPYCHGWSATAPGRTP